MRRPKFTPKTAPSPWTITIQSNTPISRPTPLTIPNGIRIQLAVLPQYILQTDRQTDRQSDRRTYGLGECSVIKAVYARLIESDTAKNRPALNQVIAKI